MYSIISLHPAVLLVLHEPLFMALYMYTEFMHWHSRDFWSEVKQINRSKHAPPTAPVIRLDGVSGDAQIANSGQKTLKIFTIAVIQARE